MKYIDAEKLIAEIERLNSLVSYENKDRHDEGLHDAYKAVKNVITSLQQEQSEVDLEKEMDKFYGMYRDENGLTYDCETNRRCPDWKDDEDEDQKLPLARHFYELGLANVKEAILEWYNTRTTPHCVAEGDIVAPMREGYKRVIDFIDNLTK